MVGGVSLVITYLSSKVELQSKCHLFLNLLSQTYRRSCEKKSEGCEKKSEEEVRLERGERKV